MEQGRITRRPWSLSPSKSLQSLSKNVSIDRTGNREDNHRCESHCPSFSLAMNMVESLLTTPRGDLLVCRDRISSAAFEESATDCCNQRPESPEMWCENDLFEENALCNPCADNSVSNEKSVAYFRASGLKGGANNCVSRPYQHGSRILQGSVPINSDNETMEVEISSKNRTDSMVSDMNIVPSFDYSQFDETNMFPSTRNLLEAIPDPLKKPKTILNVMQPFSTTPVAIAKVIVRKSTTTERHQARPLKVPSVLHGVPTFLPALSHIQITQISANPLGSHVLMISSDALLFSYGLNLHGQLGLGFKSAPSDNAGFIRSPTIVTPLLENGGKAVTCAAGVNHSLVVVRTEGRRVGRLLLSEKDRGSRQQPKQSLESSIQMNRATSSPLRLVSDELRTDENVDRMERTIHMHQLYGFGKNDCMKLGLLHPSKLQGLEDDIHLPRRVALLCQVWPDESGGGIFSVAAGEHHSAALIRQPTGAVELYTWGDATHLALGLSSVTSRKEMQMWAPRIVPTPHLVDSLLYQPSYYQRAPPLSGCQTLPEQPEENRSILFTTGRQPEMPVQVSLGRNSTFVVTSYGRCLSFGTCQFGLLGHGKRSTAVHEPTPIHFSRNGKVVPHITSVSVGATHALATCKSGQVFKWGTDTVTGDVDWKPQITESSGIVKACAGYDSSIVVNRQGKTLSFGKGSGRLGLGEGRMDQQHPIQLFGGLQLWR